MDPRVRSAGSVAIALSFMITIAAAVAPAPAEAAGALALKQQIALPGVSGRIDHLALDAKGNRLFIAEHDNNSLDVVDLGQGRVAGRIDGLSQPQGAAWLAESGQIAVANGGDGAVRFYDGATLKPTGVVSLDGDADNIRLGPAAGQIIVGYGGGGLAVIDAARHAVLKRIAMPAHPESFQLQGGRIIVNVPEAGGMAVADLASGQVSRLPLKGRGANFPMALLPDTGQVAVAFRAPAGVALIDPGKGVTASAPACEDADDLFFDAPRQALYVACGQGVVDIFNVAPGRLTRTDRVPSAAGARTALFDAASRRLYVAAPARGGAEAKLLLFDVG